MQRMFFTQINLVFVCHWFLVCVFFSCCLFAGCTRTYHSCIYIYIYICKTYARSIKFKRFFFHFITVFHCLHLVENRFYQDECQKSQCWIWQTVVYRWRDEIDCCFGDSLRCPEARKQFTKLCFRRMLNRQLVSSVNLRKQPLISSPEMIGWFQIRQRDEKRFCFEQKSISMTPSN